MWEGAQNHRMVTLPGITRYIPHKFPREDGEKEGGISKDKFKENGQGARRRKSTSAASWNAGWKAREDKTKSQDHKRAGRERGGAKTEG